MPDASDYLEDAPYPAVACPKCGAFPLVPYMRGRSQRQKLGFNWLKLFPVHIWWGWKRFGTFRAALVSYLNDAYRMPKYKERPYCAIICIVCKKTVGWEAPSQDDIERYHREHPSDPMVINIPSQIRAAALNSMNSCGSASSSVISSSVNACSPVMGCKCPECEAIRKAAEYKG